MMPASKSPAKINAADWPALATEMRKVSELVPYARNSRTHSEDQVEKIAASIREFGWTIPVLADEEGGMIAGHGRVMAAELLGIEEVPTMTARGWSDEKKRAYVIADNKLAEEAGWDDALLKLELGDLRTLGFDISITGFDESFLDGLGDDLSRSSAPSLADRFGVPPFSVLNAREGWWQDRKRGWLALGIESEVGRGGNLIERSIFDRLLVLRDWRYPEIKVFVEKHRKAGKTDAEIEALASRETKRKGQTASLKGGLTHGTTTDPYRKPGADTPPSQSGTSIFDPVLCELVYRWFCPPGGVILDPFAGGSVRGIVAGKLGRFYIGQELRAEQVEANIAQADAIFEGDDSTMPAWFAGDSRRIAEIAGAGLREGADFLFSCPPYADLEVYSDDPADLSTLGYADFRSAYAEIIAESVKLLRPDSFACFVVGEVRGPKGGYLGFVPDTIAAFREAGLEFYNEAILVTHAGSLPMRTAKQFEGSRKLGKTHQNVLVFVKGSGKAATARCGHVSFDEMIDEEAIDERPDSDFGEPL